jgi:hypothetical protein
MRLKVVACALLLASAAPAHAWKDKSKPGYSDVSLPGTCAYCAERYSEAVERCNVIWNSAYKDEPSKWTYRCISLAEVGSQSCMRTCKKQ